MIQKLNQNNYTNTISDGVIDQENLLPPKEEVLEVLSGENQFEFENLNDNQLDYIIDFLDLLDQYDDCVETFAEKTSIKPPAYMSAAANKGLRIRNEQVSSNKCCLPTGLARAQQLVKRQNLSLKTIKRIKSFVSRHGANIKPGTEKTSKLWQSLMLWGVPYSPKFEIAKANVERVKRWADMQIKKLT